MAIIALAATQEIVQAGLAPVYQGSLTTTDTYTVPCDGKTFLHFKKSGAGSCNVTIITPGSVEGLAVADLVVAVPATTGDRMIGRLTPSTFADPLTGLLTFSLSEITGLTVAALRFQGT